MKAAIGFHGTPSQDAYFEQQANILGGQVNMIGNQHIRGKMNAMYDPNQMTHFNTQTADLLQYQQQQEILIQEGRGIDNSTLTGALNHITLPIEQNMI